MKKINRSVNGINSLPAEQGSGHPGDRTFREVFGIPPKDIAPAIRYNGQAEGMGRTVQEEEAVADMTAKQAAGRPGGREAAWNFRFCAAYRRSCDA
jgi:hypothetical protein